VRDNKRLARYLLRCPLSLSRIHWTAGSKTLFYDSRRSPDDPCESPPEGETLDILEFLARVLTQIPEPRKHNATYFGAYSSRAPALQREKTNLRLPSLTGRHSSTPQDEPTVSPQNRAALRRQWARLIRRVYQTDPLKCEFGDEFRIIAFITEQKVIQKILRHLKKRQTDSRAPPKH
jgi:hypothetical protein